MFLYLNYYGMNAYRHKVKLKLKKQFNTKKKMFLY